MTVPEPCLKCKGKAHIVYLGLNYGYVKCDNCGIRTQELQIDEAIASWNVMCKLRA